MNRTNLWLVALLVLQVIFFGTLYVFCGQQEGEQIERVLLLQGMPRDGIKQVTVENAEGKSLVLSRAEKGWVLSSKSDYSVDPEKMSRLLAKLFGLESSYLVSTGTQHHRELEVAHDKYRRKVTLEAGAANRVLLLGSVGTDNFARVRVQSEPAVYAVDDIREWDLSIQISDWAKNPWFEVDASRVAGFDIERGNLRMGFRRSYLDKWMLGEKPTDSGKVNGWLNQVSKLQLSDIVGKVSESEVLNQMQKNKQQLVVTLLVAEEPLKVSLPEGTSVDLDKQANPEAVDSIANPVGDAQASKLDISPKPLERKVLRFALGPDEDSAALVYVEGEPYLVKVDGWRIKELLGADPKKLTK